MSVQPAKPDGVASRLRALRGGRPQPQIAEQVGVSLRAYQEWEAGGGIAWANLKRLADIHGVSTAWLEHGDERPELAQPQLNRIENKLDEVLARLGAVPTSDLFEPPRDELDSALGGQQGSPGQRAG
jgi:transcriptional regulator with XRE-family HTH domain